MLIVGAFLVVATGLASADTPGTTITVTPSTSLNPAGQAVVVEGSGFTPLEHFLVFQCHVLEAPPPPPASPNEACVPIAFQHFHADEAGNIGPWQ